MKYWSGRSDPEACLKTECVFRTQVAKCDVAQKHTAKEINQKVFAATVNRGGGSSGKADRLGGKAGHAKYECPVCGQQAPDTQSCEMHWDAKHNKTGPFDLNSWTDVHAECGGVATAGIAARGGLPDKSKGPRVDTQSRSGTPISSR